MELFSASVVNIDPRTATRLWMTRRSFAAMHDPMIAAKAEIMKWQMDLLEEQL